MRTAYDAHLGALRVELAERRAIANAAIAKYWPPTLRVDPNADGYYVWATASRECRARALLASAERRGVSFLFGEPFFAQGGGDHSIRIALTPVPREAIEEGIKRIGQVLDA
jgi:DNA-binding transcriptional MocR family regulator